MVATHVVSWSGDVDSDLPGTPREVEAEIRRLLENLDGGSHFALILWKLPAGMGLGELSPAEYTFYSGSYMQCAGNFDGRMTCEMRELIDGDAARYTLGRSEDGCEHLPVDEIVRWSEYETAVRSNEVLTGREVAELFVHYYRTGSTPPGYARRRLGPAGQQDDPLSTRTRERETRKGPVMPPTHAWTRNGYGECELDWQIDGAEEEMRRVLEELDADRSFAFSLRKLPEGKRIRDVVKGDPARQNYMQCAGDYNGRMTCEIRELVDGEPVQYTLGHAGEADRDLPVDEIVPWGEYEAFVRANEVLTGPEVADLFVHYYRTGTNPPEYARRELDLSKPTGRPRGSGDSPTETAA